MKIIFVVNNKNNRLSTLLPGLRQFFDDEYPGQVEYHLTLRKRHAEELSRKAVEGGCDFLIAVGGDGTLHEVVNGLFQSGLTPDKFPAVGLLPCGSANDFARTTGISYSAESLHKVIESNTIRKIDVGVIRLHATQETRYFINISGVGLGAEVVLHMEKSKAILGPAFHYFRNIIKGFFSYRKKEIRCSSKTWQWNGKVLQIAVGNGRYLGHGICITPDARLDDGLFQIAIFGDLNLWHYIKNLGKLKKGIRIDHSRVSYQTTKEICLESSDACGIEADGEYVGKIPATLAVIPNALRFLIPVDTRKGIG